MDKIFIRNIEYTYITSLEKVLVDVTFDFGIIKDCKVKIDIKDAKNLSDVKIKQFILRTLDELMERKYIDEV